MKQLTVPERDAALALVLFLLLMVFLYVVLFGDVLWVKAYFSTTSGLQWQNLKPLPG